jgi:MFS family permease
VTARVARVPRRPPAVDAGSQRYRTRAAFAVCLVAVGLAVLDTSKVNVAIPAIKDDLDAGAVLVQFIVAGYPLALGLVLIPAGRIGDHRSRRTLFLVGVMLFGIASLGCALAPTAEVLSAARLVEGIAAGILLPQALGLIQQLFTGPRERGKAFGLYGVVIGLTAGVAPPIGGLLQELGGDEWGWRFVFLINVPLVLLVIPFAVRHLPRHRPMGQTRYELDPVGVVVLALAISALMIPFVFTTGTAADRPERWLLLPAAAGLIGLLWWWEGRYKARGRNPALNFSLFRIRSFRNGVVISFAYYAGAPAAVLLMTLTLQLHLGTSALTAGLAMLPFGAAYMASAWLCGLWTFRFGRSIVIGGLSLVAIGWTLTALAVCLISEPQAAFIALLLCQLVAGAGSGAVGAPNQTLMLEKIAVGQAGLAGSITQVAQRLGSATGIAVATAVFYDALGRGEAAGTGQDYPLAFALGIGSVVVMTLLSLVVAWADRRWRRRAGITPHA